MMREKLSAYVQSMMDRYPGLSYRKASEDAGLSNAVIGKIINMDGGKPTPKTLKKIAKKWGTDEDYRNLMRLAGYLPPEPAVDSPELERLIRLVGQLDPEYLIEAIRYVNYLVENQRSDEAGE